MLAFERVRRREISLAELVADLTVDDLRDLTNEMVDTMLALLAGGVDADVPFEPEEPDAHDAAAADEGEVALP